MADGLANLALSLLFGVHNFDIAPLEVGSLLQENVDGSLRPWQTRVVVRSFVSFLINIGRILPISYQKKKTVSVVYI